MLNNRLHMDSGQKAALTREPKRSKLAFSSGADYIVTYNTDNFSQAKMFGTGAVTPKAFLQKIGEIK